MMSLTNIFQMFAPPIPGAEISQGSIGGLVLYVLIALGVSFLCSILEAVLLSASVSYIENLAQQGNQAGKVMQKHKQNIERPISAILTLNTIAHTVGAAGAGAQAAGLFGNQYVGAISAVLTLLILIFSEIIPKTLGAVYWKQLTRFSAYTIQALVILLYPVVRIFELMTSLLRHGEEGPTISRMEFETLARMSTSEGTLLEGENRILKNLLHLQNVNVSEIMTPRTVVLGLQEDLTVKQALDSYADLPYSRIPIFKQAIDDTTAYVLRQDITERVAADEHNTKLSTLRRDLHSIPETNNVAETLDEFIAKKEHIFLIFDEFGGAAGVITLEDAIESLLGIEITDESDLVTDLRQLAIERHNRKMTQQTKPQD
jgi:CBS domain containing-hemolysin-like protein